MSKKLFIYIFAIILLICICVSSNIITAHATGDRQVAITKTLVADDINWHNGNPIFIYELSTINGISSGNRRYYAAIEFTEEYVKNNTDGNGTVSKTITITEIERDTYVLIEQDTLRYYTPALEDDDVVNGVASTSYWKELQNGDFIEIQKNQVMFTLTKNSNGAASFRGVKTNWADASHTALVINQFKYE